LVSITPCLSGTIPSSLFEWYHPLYMADKASNFSNNTFVREKVVPEMVELVEKYRPQVIWSDGDWEVGPEYWDSLEFLAWLYNSSPVKDTVVTNDRWGRGIMCHHGDFFTCSDRYNPGVLQSHKWENAMTVDKESWGHRRNMKMEDVLSMEELIETMASTVSCGGNLLVNVGPHGIHCELWRQLVGECGSLLRWHHQPHL